MSFGPSPANKSRKTSSSKPANNRTVSSSKTSTHAVSHSNANESTPVKIHSTGRSSNVYTPGVSLKNVYNEGRFAGSSIPLNVDHPISATRSTASPPASLEGLGSPSSSPTLNSTITMSSSKSKKPSLGNEEEDIEEIATPGVRSDASNEASSSKPPQSGNTGERSDASEKVDKDGSSHKDKGKAAERTREFNIPPLIKGAEISKDYPLIFYKFKDVLLLYDEPLFSSVSRYYAPYSSAAHHDPLTPFGVHEDGRMPGRSMDDSCFLRETIIRWEHQMETFPFGDRFKSVKDYANHFPSLHFDYTSILELSRPNDQLSLFSIGLEPLRSIGHLVLGLNQILDCLPKFIDSSQRSTFVLDQNFTLLKAIEIHRDPDVILASLKGLQIRTKVSLDRIDLYLRRIQLTYAPNFIEPSEADGSYYSTVASEQMEFIEGSAEDHLGKLFSRKDYSSAMQDSKGVLNKFLQNAVDGGYQA
ncbi:hypothetical protein VKT23_009462 [Stygiomarasmius scandens]|uniref:Uncharacterized protein n=1 Tax=Marasmiellus scandens TaxID=2682957 RepID=A0ABR1JGJ0_9AGAR